jgi:hypothetical protein
LPENLHPALRWKLNIRKDQVEILSFEQLKSLGSRNGRLGFITFFSEDDRKKVENAFLVVDNEYFFRFGLPS